MCNFKHMYPQVPDSLIDVNPKRALELALCPSTHLPSVKTGDMKIEHANYTKTTGMAISSSLPDNTWEPT